MKGRFWWGVVAALCAWNAYDHLVDGKEFLRGAVEAAVALLLAVGLLRDAYGARTARRMTDDFGTYLRSQEDRAGVYLARRDTDGTWLQQHAHNADERFPLASTRKVLILCALSEQIHQGAISADERLPLREVRRFHLPGTDGGAFAQAYPQARRRTEISIRDCAEAMIHQSCNASAEYLWRRVGGRPALAALARSHHMDGQDPVHSGYGEFVAVLPPFLLRTLRCPDERLADYYDRLGARPHRWYRLLLLLPTAGLQPRVFRRGCSGTPRDWVTLFQAVVDAPAGDSPLAFAREILRWPMRTNPANTKVYHEVLAKGGALPGAVTQVYALHSRTSPGPAVMACFLKDLPSAEWKILSGTPRQDRYMVATMNRSGA